MNHRPLFFIARSSVMLFALIALQACGPIIVVGAATGVMMSNDRRSAGTIIDDKGIELKIGNRIGFDKALADKVHVSANAFNKTVLLTGEVPSEELRDQIVAFAGSTDGVKQVYNALDISLPTEYKSRNFDTWLTSKVKSKMFGRKDFEAVHIKVVSENAVVYLMGMVNQTEADTAAQIASEIEGVKRVVKVFEYIEQK